MLGKRIGLAEGERTAGLDDLRLEHKTLAASGCEQRGLDLDGEDVGLARHQVKAATPQALSSPAVMMPAWPKPFCCVKAGECSIASSTSPGARRTITMPSVRIAGWPSNMATAAAR